MLHQQTSSRHKPRKRHPVLPEIDAVSEELIKQNKKKVTVGKRPESIQTFPARSEPIKVVELCAYRDA